MLSRGLATAIQDIQLDDGAIGAVLAAITPEDALHLMAELAKRIPHGAQGAGNPCVSVCLGYSDAAYALIAEMPGRHLHRELRIASVQIGALSVAASGLPKVAGPDDSQMVRPDGPTEVR